MSLFHILKKHSYAKDQTYKINVIMLIKTLGNHLEFFFIRNVARSKDRASSLLSLNKNKNEILTALLQEWY